jgi:hypothetical protein
MPYKRLAETHNGKGGKDENMFNKHLWIQQRTDLLTAIKQNIEWGLKCTRNQVHSA